ncbi:hypothetical protein NPIL_416031 [Nephila pilipes]|uniref:Uncharacterized protein n=1 Tax=Nephila pilipes TaxID=299642 RepID=A0A8X6NMN6_NEPPI|nr:hypothetical protein NPIL_416031 [Nephila pilipes]
MILKFKIKNTNVTNLGQGLSSLPNEHKIKDASELLRREVAEKVKSIDNVINFDNTIDSEEPFELYSERLNERIDIDFIKLDKSY